MNRERLKARMDWKMPWVSITDSFDADFGVDQWHGHNAFIRDGGRVFRTYFVPRPRRARMFAVERRSGMGCDLD